MQYWEWKKSQYPCYRVGNNSWYCFDWSVVVDHMETHCHWPRKSALWLAHFVTSFILIGSFIFQFVFLIGSFGFKLLFSLLILTLFFFFLFVCFYFFFFFFFFFLWNTKNDIIFYQVQNPEILNLENIKIYSVNMSDRKLENWIMFIYFLNHVFFRINWNIENLKMIVWNRNGRR